MAPKHYSSPSFEAYTPSFEDEVESYTYDHESSHSDTLVGSDTEYICESEPESEVDSAEKLRSRSKSKSKSKTDAADPKSKKKSSPPPAAKDKRPRKEKPADQSGSACKKKMKKTNADNGGDADGLAMETEKVKKKENSTSLSVGRVWSESDEIGILIGLVSFHKKYKKFDANKFYSKIIKYIKADVPKARVLEKVVRLKAKYYDHKSNRGPNGEDPVFSKPHEQALFEISKLVWGNDVEKRRIEDGAGDEKLQEEEEDENEDEDLYDYDDLVLEAFDNYLVSQEIELGWIGQEQLESLENKWRTLKVAESKFRFKQAWLDGKVHRLALITYKSFDF